MSNPVIQYFKDTRSELNHVAWPTQKQTVVFTVLVVAISLGVAGYLGAFDYLFTNALSYFVNTSENAAAVQVTQQPATTSTTSSTNTQSPTVTGPTFNIPGATPSSGSTNSTK